MVPTHYTVEVKRYSPLTDRIETFIELWYKDRYRTIDPITNQMVDRWGTAGDIVYQWYEDENGYLIRFGA